MHLHRTLRSALLAAAVALLLAACGEPAALPDADVASQVAVGDALAFDMVGSTSMNLTSFDNSAPTFSSAGDGFGKFQRGVSLSIPFSLLDDSLSIFPPDSLGIVGEANTDEFFGVTDTENADNSGPVSASWTFDVSGSDEALALSVDVGAMGDFESSDTFVWTYAFDGRQVPPAFESAVDEAGSATYTLDGGASFTLSDPMTLEGTVLSDDFATFQVPLLGQGDELVVTLTASTNGGSEAFAFQNLEIVLLGGDPPAPPPLFSDFCGESADPIGVIQGSGFSTPAASDDVFVIEGVVVGDFQGDDGDPFGTDLGGFFVQDGGDGDPATSDGIFVDAPGAIDVAVGDVVRVEGNANENFGNTQLESVDNLAVCGTADLPAPTPVTLPADDATLEMVEGMYVLFPQELTISEYFNFDRFGEIVLALPNPGDEDRQFQPTSFVEPGPAAETEAEQNELRRITLDDGRGNQNPDPARHPNGDEFTLDNRFRGGDLVEDATGVLNYAFGRYRIQPTEGATYIPTNPRPEAPESVGGALKVAAFNVLNYFPTIDDGTNDICGPNFDQECRGADSLEEFERQEAKIVAALATLDADVVGLIEIQNNAGAVQTLVDALNAAVGAGTYVAVEDGTLGPDAIKVSMIYKPASVATVGTTAVLDSDAFLDPNELGEAKNRAALAQSFVDLETRGVTTVVVNHFKSKGSPCGEGDDDPLAGSCNLTRALAAQVQLDWLATDPTRIGDTDTMIVGDLNSYDEEDPIDVLAAAGYVDLLEAYEGEFAYTYVFDGQFGHLDYGTASETLAPQVTGATAWHINADEPDILDYDTSFKQDAQDDLFAVNPYRSSDHDPVLVGLELDDDLESLTDLLGTGLAALDVNRGVARSVEGKFDRALRAAEAGRLDSAVGQLTALGNQLLDLGEDGVIPADEAARLAQLAYVLGELL